VTAVGDVPDVPWNEMALCSCHFVRLPNKALLTPPKKLYWPQIGSVSDNFYNFVNHLTWPDQANKQFSKKNFIILSPPHRPPDPTHGKQTLIVSDTP